MSPSMPSLAGRPARSAGRTSGTLEVAGHTVVTHRWGPGPPRVVLVHGIGVSHRYFRPAARLLAARGLGVLAPDLPGFGRSPRPERPLSVSHQAEVLGGLLDALGVRAGEVVLVGHSMGAQVVTALAAARPGLARAVVLVGAVAEPGARSAVRQAWRLVRDSRHEPWRANLLMVRDWLRCGPRWYVATVPELLAYRLEEHLGEVCDPVVLVRGERDPVTRAAYQEGLVAVVEGSAGNRTPVRSLVVPGEGHIVMMRRPEVLADLC